MPNTGDIRIPTLQSVGGSFEREGLFSVVSQIAAEDVTFAANFIQSRTFRAFEAYFVSTAIYLVLSILLRKGLDYLGLFLFPATRVDSH